MAKVSIIVPIYNVEKYVRKTIDSVVNQTEKDIEIILVDDGSTDGSGKICDEYALRDARIIVIHKMNGGLSSARNTGIKIAKADYIMLLDGDDYLDSHAVSILIDAVVKYPSDLIQFHYQEVDGLKKAEQIQVDNRIYQARTLKEIYDNLYKIGGEAVSACTKLYRSNLLKRNLFEDVQHEDEMWCTHAFKEGVVITYIPDILYYYVMRNDSIIHKEFNLKKLDVFTVIEERIRALKQKHLEEYVHIEYEKMFFFIISLYCQTQNKEYRKLLQTIYEKNKKQISQNAILSGKFKMLNTLMKIKFSLINIYKLYWRVVK